jgi:hypothetical protein
VYGKFSEKKFPAGGAKAQRRAGDKEEEILLYRVASKLEQADETRNHTKADDRARFLVLFHVISWTVRPSFSFATCYELSFAPLRLCGKLVFSNYTIL